MKTIPILLTFDGNMSLPAGVCIYSLLASAREDTFYDINVFHPGERPAITGLDKLYEAYDNFKVTFHSVGDEFKGAYEIRGITYAAYYRLLAPEILTDYDKVVYFDVDMIFRRDLSDLYDIDLSDNYLGAVYAISMNTEPESMRYAESVGAVPGEYFLSGFLVMNLDLMRRDNLVPRFKELAANNYRYQDMDIINIVCKGRIMPIPCEYSFVVGAYNLMETDPSFMGTKYAPKDAEDARLHGNIHYNGPKPWKDWCPNMDIWWEHYRHSPFFDSKFYFAFFYNKLDHLDALPLSKRLKLVARYFTQGRKSPRIAISKDGKCID